MRNVLVAEVLPADKRGVTGVLSAVVVTVAVAVVVAVPVSMSVAVSIPMCGVTPAVGRPCVPAHIAAGADPNHVGPCVGVAGLPDPAEAGVSPAPVVVGYVTPGFVGDPGPSDPGANPPAVGVWPPARGNPGAPNTSDSTNPHPFAIARQDRVEVEGPVGVGPRARVDAPITEADRYAEAAASHVYSERTSGLHRWRSQGQPDCESGGQDREPSRSFHGCLPDGARCHRQFGISKPCANRRTLNRSNDLTFESVLKPVVMSPPEDGQASFFHGGGVG